MTHERLNFNLEEKMQTVTRHETITIAENGLGFGKGSISPENTNLAVLEKVESAVKTPDIMTAVSPGDDGRLIDDDGCGDGREVKRILRGFDILKKSLNRQKVMGGGLTMTASAMIGLGKLDGTVHSAFVEAGTYLRAKGENYGAHTADQAHGSNCGCGAIDHAPEILQTALDYKYEIKDTVTSLFSPDEQDGDLDGILDVVFENFSEFTDSSEFKKETYRGTEVMAEIARRDKIVKELTDDHKEKRIVLNVDIEDSTVDQGFVRDLTNGEGQVFGVDIPRIYALASLHSTDEERNQAFVSMLVYTLATAAHLTKGDLPVDLIYQDSHYISFHNIESLEAQEFELAA